MADVAIIIKGGLGDCIWDYLKNDCQKVLSIKEKHDLCVSCYIYTNNSETKELLRYNPHFDYIFAGEYCNDDLILNRRLLNQVFDLSKYPDKPMPIYLGVDEQIFLDKVIAEGDYVVIHPFAGEDRRCFNQHLSSRLSMPSFIEKIVERYNVVIVGGSFTREKSELEGEKIEARKEMFNYTHPRVMNFVNISGVRLSCALVQHAKYFIGSHSCYQMAAWAYGIRSLCLVPEGFLGYLSPHSTGVSFDLKPYVQYVGYRPGASHLFLPGNKIMFIEQMPHIQRFLDDFFE